MEHPKLRPLEAFFAEKNAICIRDPEGFSESVLLLQPAAFFICSLFDGTHSIIDIQSEFMRQFGEVLFTEQVKEIEARLDSCFFLDNERFGRHREKITSDFHSSTVRQAAHAGKAYEDDPAALKGSLGLLLDRDNNIPESVSPEIDGKISAVMAPHIDIGRGGDCYASAYGALASGCNAKTFVVLGISHMPSTMPYILTKKAFVTPLGTLDPDTDFIERLSSRCTTDFYRDELIHRSEHSVEFQSLFLKYLFPEPADIRIVPVLCSSVARVLLSEKSPYEDKEVREFIDALRETIEERSDEICIIAGVDLSHVGKRFGQDIRITSEYLEDLESSDKSLIDRILDCDAEGFMKSIKRDNDARNVCGVPALYTMLKLIATKKGKLLKYGQSVEENTQSVVTFASAAFYE